MGRRLGVLAVFCAIVAVAQIAALHAGGVASPRKIIGLMTGLPSVWPFLNLAAYSPGASVVVAIGALGLPVATVHGAQAQRCLAVLCLECLAAVAGTRIVHVVPRTALHRIRIATAPSVRVRLHSGGTPAAATGDGGRLEAVARSGRLPAVCCIHQSGGSRSGRERRIYDSSGSQGGGGIHEIHAARAQRHRSCGGCDRTDLLSGTRRLLAHRTEVADSFIQDWKGRIVDIYTHTR